MKLKEMRAATKAKAQTILDGVKAQERDLTDEEITTLDGLKAEIAELDAKIERAEKSEETFKAFEGLRDDEKQPEAKAGDKPAKSLGEHFVKHVGDRMKSYKESPTTFHMSAPEFIPSKANTSLHVTDGPGSDGDFADWLVDIDKDPGNWVRAKRDRLYIADLLGTGSISGDSIKYYLEGAFEGEFQTVAEGGLKPQVHVANPTTQIDSVTKLAAFFKFSDETLEDLAFWVSEVNNRALYELAVEEENQLLNGDPSNPPTSGRATDLVGILHRSGLQTETSASYADNPDALFRAMAKVEQETNYRADALVINPLDYQDLRLRKDGNGQYMAGGFFQGQYANGGIQENPPVWGLRTVVTNAVAAGSPIVGAWRQSATLYRKGGVRVETTNANENDFIYNRVTTRVEERIALAVRQPKGFVKVSLDTDGADDAS